ncbi:hypothetical protein GS398_06885 [Pedobacter sp. HMF7056]|uniref:Uncharacterized protein n=2 Tax=Hufsiella ginkgonis TaxID=2695274 RepID=A0A7K1XW69_9SPHI|nr:hypothetical protein [Hufsiella ginkgonis]
MIETGSASSSLTEVFHTKHGSVQQCDKSHQWLIEFAGKSAKFDYRCLLKLKKAVYSIDIERALLDTAAVPDVEIIFLCACEHCYVLSVAEVIALKELLQGTFVMLELNHLITDCLNRLVY